MVLVKARVASQGPLGKHQPQGGNLRFTAGIQIIGFGSKIRHGQKNKNECHECDKRLGKAFSRCACVPWPPLLLQPSLTPATMLVSKRARTSLGKPEEINKYQVDISTKQRTRGAS